MIFDREKLINRMREDYPDVVSYDYIASKADELINSIDSRLEKNLEEYINNENISNIYIGKYCVNAILKIRNNHDIPDALIALNTYASDPEKGKILIWSHVRR